MEDLEPPSNRQDYPSFAFQIFLTAYVCHIRNEASLKETGELAAIIYSEDQGMNQIVHLVQYY